MPIKKAEGFQKAQLYADRFEAIADAAMRAMFWVDGRIEDTPSAKCVDNEVVATRAFKARFRKELRAANFNIWAKWKKWL